MSTDQRAPRSPQLRILAAAAVAIVIAGCGGSTASDAPGSPTPAAAPTDGVDQDTTSLPPSASLPAAPWSRDTLGADEVPAAYRAAFGDAENRDWCALLAFRDPPAGGSDVEPTVRTAQFGGGWGVAYDLPGLRGAFGVAGTGVEPSPDAYDDWPYRIRWRDGSRTGYGPEGGSGPNQLAYLRVQGQRCLYNVWSHLGREHLEALLEELRFVDPRLEAEGQVHQ